MTDRTAEVFEFPSGPAREWARVAASIRELMKKGGYSNPMIEWILADMKPRVTPLLFEVKCPADAGPATRDLVEVLHRTTGLAILQILLLEVFVYATEARSVEA